MFKRQSDKTNTKSFFKKNFILLILIFALILRLFFLSNSPDLVDETNRLTWGESNEGLKEKLLADIHPPLSYQINYFLYDLTGSVLITRLFFLFFGILNIYLIYILAKKFNVEKIATFLATINLFSIAGSIHIAPYVILGTLTLLSVLIIIDLFKKRTTLSLILLGIIWGLGVSLHYYFIFLAIPQFLFIIYLLIKKKRLYLGLIPAGISFLIFLPNLSLFIHQVFISSKNYAYYINTTLAKLILTASLFYLPHAFSVAFILSNKLVLFVSLTLFLIYTLLLLRSLFELKKCKKNFALLSLALSFFGFIILNLILSLARLAKIHTRYLSMIFPLYLIMVSIGLSKIKNKNLRNITLILIFILSAIAILLAYSIFPFGREIVF